EEALEGGLILEGELGDGVEVEVGLRAHDDRGGILGVALRFALAWSAVDVPACVREGVVLPGDGALQRHVDAFVVRLELLGSGAWLAIGEEEDSVAHLRSSSTGVNAQNVR